jgi:hypothetical protein
MERLPPARASASLQKVEMLNKVVTARNSMMNMVLLRIWSPFKQGVQIRGDSR